MVLITLVNYLVGPYYGGLKWNYFLDMALKELALSVCLSKFGCEHLKITAIRVGVKEANVNLGPAE